MGNGVHMNVYIVWGMNARIDCTPLDSQLRYDLIVVRIDLLYTLTTHRSRVLESWRPRGRVGSGPKHSPMDNVIFLAAYFCHRDRDAQRLATTSSFVVRTLMNSYPDISLRLARPPLSTTAAQRRHVRETPRWRQSVQVCVCVCGCHILMTSRVPAHRSCVPPAKRRRRRLSYRFPDLTEI